MVYRGCFDNPNLQGLDKEMGDAMNLIANDKKEGICNSYICCMHYSLPLHRS